MFRYIAVVWNAHDEVECAEARRLSAKVAHGVPDMKAVLRCAGLRVWIATPPPFHYLYMLENECGVVLGTLFRGRTAARIAQGAMTSVDAACLISNYWGRYVAFLYDAEAATTRVVRDPSAGLYCYRIGKDGCDVYFADVNDCAKLGVSLSVDWDYVAAHITAQELDSHRTVSREVSEVQPGRCIERRNSHRSTLQLWNPALLASTNVIEDKQEARTVLREAVTVGIAGWASCHERIVVHASGGLDSSIILACLKEAYGSDRVYGLNYYAPGCDSDERSYARLVCEWLGCHLIERERNSQVDLSQMLNFARSLRLIVNPLRVETSRAEAALAQDIGATASFSGGGGDAIFGSGWNHWAAVDYARAHGFGFGLIRIALDASLLERRSVWNVLALAMTYGILRRACAWNPLDEAGAKQPLASEDAATASVERRSVYHDWSNLAAKLPPRKLAYLSMLTSRDMHDPLAQPGDPDLLQPLMSQPLMEVGLRIATYVLSCDGWDRGLARCAFENDLPPQIVRRRNKGGATEHLQAMLRYNLSCARDLLLDGLLAQRGLVDRTAIAASLADDPARSVEVMHVLHVLAAEARLRAWVS